LDLFFFIVFSAPVWISDGSGRRKIEQRLDQVFGFSSPHDKSRYTWGARMTFSRTSFVAFVFVGLISFSAEVVSTPAFADVTVQRKYPLHPDPKLTPGDLCEERGDYRYPERIRYCERDVSSARKMDIFQDYIELGYAIDLRERSSYKIDHLIPLCAGGSNDTENLWPQHQNVYEITDPLEPLVCEKMKMGVLKQRDAVDLILRAKHDLEEAPSIIDYVDRL
jgi:hypothetical protein